MKNALPVNARPSSGRQSPPTLPDKEAQFLIAYLPLEFAALATTDQQETVRDLCENCGSRPRGFRNGLGIAVPAVDQIEVLRRAVRYLLAVERVRGKWREHNLTDAQKSQLRERAATEKAAAESALLKLYGEVWLPAYDSAAFSVDSVSMGGRPLQTTLDQKKRALIHQRLLELLTTVQRRVFGTVAPPKILELFNLGEGGTAEPGISTEQVVAGFFSFLGFPRLQFAGVVKKAIIRGVEIGVFGYTTGRPSLGDGRRYLLDRSRVAFERHVADDEIDLDSGFLIVPAALPEEPRPTETVTGSDSGEDDIRQPQGTDNIGEGNDTTYATRPVVEEEREVAFSFTADRDALFTAWNALANLADLVGKVSVSAKGTSLAPIDKHRLENGVLEPLRELGLIDDTNQ